MLLLLAGALLHEELLRSWLLPRANVVVAASLLLQGLLLQGRRVLLRMRLLPMAMPSLAAGPLRVH